MFLKCLLRKLSSKELQEVLRTAGQQLSGAQRRYSHLLHPTSSPLQRFPLFAPELLHVPPPTLHVLAVRGGLREFQAQGRACQLPPHGAQHQRVFQRQDLARPGIAQQEAVGRFHLQATGQDDVPGVSLENGSWRQQPSGHHVIRQKLHEELRLATLELFSCFNEGQQSLACLVLQVLLPALCGARQKALRLPREALEDCQLRRELRQAAQKVRPGQNLGPRHARRSFVRRRNAADERHAQELRLVLGSSTWAHNGARRGRHPGQVPRTGPSRRLRTAGPNHQRVGLHILAIQVLQML
mmetsp:Transcript_8395/g.14487  ORF Transcript_8395/g.14487 Transcript_8395/m.14487 type:complete len:298 (+) Transcript_8395:1151-2044(+)